MGPIFWAFEEREALMELCEQASGARMHTALYRPFSFDFSVISGIFIRELGHFLSRCGRSLAGAFLGLLNNRSLKSRLSFVGQLSLAKVEAYGITGLIARSCGGLYDLRLQGRAGYTLYRGLAFRLFIGRRGDNFDRFLLRVKEVSECFRVLSQAVQALQPVAHSAVAALACPLLCVRQRFSRGTHGALCGSILGLDLVLRGYSVLDLSQSGSTGIWFGMRARPAELPAFQ
jgi:NADH:ubiquinone oxidoreductase subunit D